MSNPTAFRNAPLSRRVALRVGTAASAAALVTGALRRPSAVHAQAVLSGTFYSLVTLATGPLGALITFNADGTATQISTIPGNSAAHGAWQVQADGSFLVILRNFTFDQDGKLNGSVKVRFQLQLTEDGTGYSSTGVAEILALDGSVQQTRPLQSRATRVDPEPLP